MVAKDILYSVLYSTVQRSSKVAPEVNCGLFDWPPGSVAVVLGVVEIEDEWTTIIELLGDQRCSGQRWESRRNRSCRGHCSLYRKAPRVAVAIELYNDVVYQPLSNRTGGWVQAGASLDPRRVFRARAKGKSPPSASPVHLCLSRTTKTRPSRQD